ncbi:hypothetical protein X880_4778 [Burkholderia pseudomallei MSHR4032]|nr:hypothetical protein X880_3875 [Burkholderia pseudomallei MSHR4032]KGU91913.1 hypothetical protein X880_4778 [Burkholderia pseudomallei MSHR4032]
MRSCVRRPGRSRTARPRRGRSTRGHRGGFGWRRDGRAGPTAPLDSRRAPFMPRIPCKPHTPGSLAASRSRAPHAHAATRMIRGRSRAPSRCRERLHRRSAGDHHDGAEWRRDRRVGPTAPLDSSRITSRIASRITRRIALPRTPKHRPPKPGAPRTCAGRIGPLAPFVCPFVVSHPLAPPPRLTSLNQVAHRAPPPAATPPRTAGPPARAARRSPAARRSRRPARRSAPPAACAAAPAAPPRARARPAA